jgi:hypothetical protein
MWLVRLVVLVTSFDRARRPAPRPMAAAAELVRPKSSSLGAALAFD